MHDWYFQGGSTFNSRPHKEVDRWRWYTPVYPRPFNSRPHKEVDVCFLFVLHRAQIFQFTTSQGGRLAQNIVPLAYLFFQFTTSQGGRRGILRPHGRGAIFQFTTSQGGRRPSPVTTIMRFSFNSRPHKEVDQHLFGCVLHQDSFNSRPHKEVDV